MVMIKKSKGKKIPNQLQVGHVSGLGLKFGTGLEWLVVYSVAADAKTSRSIRSHPVTTPLIFNFI